DVWNVLLQVLDEGRLTDGQGRTVDFRNTIIILTSNIGTAQSEVVYEKFKDDPARRDELVRAAVMEEVRRTFRPELINRLDEIVIFHRLERDQLAKIVDIQLKHVEARLARRDLRLDVTDAAR